jgi:hypothetical protein
VSEAVERLELSETLERNALLLPIAYSLMPALIKRLNGPRTRRGPISACGVKKKNCGLYQETMDIPHAVKDARGVNDNLSIAIVNKRFDPFVRFRVKNDSRPFFLSRICSIDCVRASRRSSRIGI